MSRQCLVACAFVGVFLGGPTVAQAALLSSPYTELLFWSDNTDGSIGVEGLKFTTDGYSSEHQELTLRMTIVHGALNLHEEIFDPLTGAALFTTYGYAGPVSLYVTAEWTSPKGMARVGTFHAQMYSLQVTIDEDLDRAFGPQSENYLYLGDGKFSPYLARYLGVKQRTGSGSLFFVLEEVKQGYAQRPLVIYGNQLRIDVEPRAVPEPSTVLLFGAALLVGYSRGYSRRR